MRSPVLGLLDLDSSKLDAARDLRLVEALPDGARFATSLGPLVVRFYAPGLVRLRLGEGGGADYGILVEPPAGLAAACRETPRGWLLEAGDLALTLLRDGPARFVLCRRSEPLLGSATDGHFTRPFRLPPFARFDGGWFAALHLDSGDPVYGLGEVWGPLNHRGGLHRSWVEDALGVNVAASYKPVPFAWSPRGWGVFAHTPAAVTHAIGHAPWSHRSYALAVEDDALDLFLLAADDPAGLLERYTWLTGRPPRPPRWSLGAWLSRAYYRDADELLDAARTVRAREMPCDVITLDGRAWQDTPTRFAFAFDPARYPDPKAVVDELHALDFRLCCWEYPLVAVDGPLFAGMEARGHLLRDARTGAAYRYEWDPEPFGAVLTPLPTSGLVDFTHPDAFAEWRDRHRALFDLGVDVIKSDFGEQVPDEAVAHNGDSGTRLHNAYPLLYNRCVFEATARYGRSGDRPMVFARSGWAGSQRTPGHWGGDPQSDWEGLAASVRGALSWGMSGCPCHATDIGGFYGGPPEPELFVRWAQAAVFASHMRFHGIGPREPWAFGANAEAIVRRHLDLRYRLIPYIEACLAEAGHTGMPPMRAMVLARPGEPESWGFEGQYFFGPDLLVVPVLQPGGRVRAYLPEGRWYGLWGGGPIEGGRALDLAMPLDDIPVFVREGAVLPLGPKVRHTGEITPENRLERLRLYGLPAFPPNVLNGPVLEALEEGGRRLLRGVPGRARIEAFGPVAWERTPEGVVAFSPPSPAP
jgi:alpha-D-xyloside xylohydrolase